MHYTMHNFVPSHRVTLDLVPKITILLLLYVAVNVVEIRKSLIRVRRVYIVNIVEKVGI